MGRNLMLHICRHIQEEANSHILSNSMSQALEILVGSAPVLRRMSTIPAMSSGLSLIKTTAPLISLEGFHVSHSMPLTTN